MNRRMNMSMDMSMPFTEQTQLPPLEQDYRHYYIHNVITGMTFTDTREQPWTSRNAISSQHSWHGSEINHTPAIPYAECYS